MQRSLNASGSRGAHAQHDANRIQRARIIKRKINVPAASMGNSTQIINNVAGSSPHIMICTASDQGCLYQMIRMGNVIMTKVYSGFINPVPESFHNYQKSVLDQWNIPPAPLKHDSSGTSNVAFDCFFNDERSALDEGNSSVASLENVSSGTFPAIDTIYDEACSVPAPNLSSSMRDASSGPQNPFDLDEIQTPDQYY